MKSKNLLKYGRIITGVLVPAVLLICGPAAYSIGATLAQSLAPQHIDLGTGETKTITVSHAYNWTNTDPSVAELSSIKGSETAAVKGLKPGIATISVGTAIGQVMTFTYNVAGSSGNGGDNSGDGNNSGGGDNPGGGSGDQGLLKIPGLSESTRTDTVLSVDGSNWIVIKNIEMEGSKYAMLLKQTALSHIIFEMSGDRYEGSPLQGGFTGAFTDSHIPKAIMNNAVVPKLGDDSINAVSAPTSKMASSEAIKKNIIFPLSYKEAVDWSGSTNNSKLNMSSQRWWLRTPDGSKWYYVRVYTDSPDQGSVISSPTAGIQPESLHLRPAIWVKYE